MVLFQFVEVETETIQTVGQEPIQTGQMHLLHGLHGLPGGRFKFRVAGLQFLHALDIGGELIRRLDNQMYVRFGLQKGA